MNRQQRRAQAKNAPDSNKKLSEAVKLHKRGNLKKAERLYKEILESEPNNFDCYNNLGAMAAKNKDYIAAIEYLQKAIIINPKKPEVYNNIGIALYKEDYLVKAEEAFNQAFTLDPNNPATHTNIRNMAIDQGLNLYAEGDFEKSYYYLKMIHDIKTMGLAGEFAEGGKEFFNLLSALLTYHRDHPEAFAKDSDNILHTLGDSHAVSAAHTMVKFEGKEYKCVPHLSRGSQVWHLCGEEDNKYKQNFEKEIAEIPDDSVVVFTFGEIDTRYNYGIMPYYWKSKGVNLEEHITKMVKGYIAYLLSHAKPKKLDVIISGVPAPACDYSSLSEFKKKELIDMIALFNDILAKEVKANDCKFLDVYNLTIGDNGIAKDGYHIDYCHLTPDAFAEALSAIT